MDEAPESKATHWLGLVLLFVLVVLARFALRHGLHSDTFADSFFVACLALLLIIGVRRWLRRHR